MLVRKKRHLNAYRFNGRRNINEIQKALGDYCGSIISDDDETDIDIEVCGGRTQWLSIGQWVVENDDDQLPWLVVDEDTFKSQYEPIPGDDTLDAVRYGLMASLGVDMAQPMLRDPHEDLKRPKIDITADVFDINKGILK